MKENNRIYKSIRNSTYAILGQIITIALNFISRTIFIHTLGAIYLGINGLFTNILSVLSFAELGFSTAIIYEMYAPLANNDKKRVASLMNFYSKVYKYIGSSIFIIGIFLIPYLHFFIKDPSIIPANLPPLWIIFLLFLLNTSASYFFSYKRSIIVASQNSYIDSINQMEFNIIRNILQISVLFFFKSFVSFLIIQLVCTFLSNVFISIKANKLYPYLRNKKKEKINYETLHNIKKNVFAMAFNKLGGVAVSGVNNLMIAKFVGIVAVGYYSNYLLIINTIKTIFVQFFIPITASIGNFVVTKTKEESHILFLKLLFINAYIAIFLSICLSTLINSFIIIFWGKDFVFSTTLTLLIIFNFYIDRIRQSSQIFIDVNGLFWQIKWRAFCEAVFTIILVSILLIKFNMEIEGVIIGTLLNNILINLWWEGYIIYKYIFKKIVLKYLLLHIKYILVLIFCYICTSSISSLIPNSIIGFFLKTLISIVIPNIIMITIFYHTKEFQYFKDILSKIITHKIYNHE